MSTRGIAVSAPAKINLYLGVHTLKDERGYHRVDSVMAALDLVDTLTFDPADGLSVELVPAIDLPQEKNSVYRAARMLGDAFGREPSFRITVKKRIPLRAGLGGPSADAAAALVGLCRLWGIERTDARVIEIARSLGADVPFFLHGPLAYCAGAGDELAELMEPLAGLPVVLVQPAGAGVTAAEAYARFDADPVAVPPLEELLEALRAGDADAVPALIANNLAPAACAAEPAIEDVVSWLRAQPGVRAAQVTGSGSCSFAICAAAADARSIAAAARTHGWWACAATMEKSGPTVTEC